MKVLLYSMVIYLLGIAVILYLRPSYMFHENGQWKDFGVNNTDTTMFPIWMFCIVWAVVSYLIISVVYPYNTLGAKATVLAASLTSQLPEAVTPTRTNTNAATPITENSKPGYYKLDESITKKRGVPRYIYVGEEQPSDLDD